MSGTFLSSLLLFANTFFTTTIGSRYNFYSYFIDKETEAQSLKQHVQWQNWEANPRSLASESMHLANTLPPRVSLLSEWT